MAREQRESIGTRHAIDRRSWQDLVGQTVMPFDIDIPSVSDFSGKVSATRLLDATVVSMSSGLHAGERTSGAVDPVDDSTVVVTAQLEGTFRITQFDRDTTIRPGQFAVYTSDAPVQIAGSRGYRSVAVKIPMSRFRHPAEKLRELSATSFRADQGLGPAVWSFLERLEGGVSVTDPGSRASMSHHVTGLIEQLLREHMDDRPSLEELTADSTGLLDRCLTYIEQNLSDPELTPDRIAAATFISTRYLHQLFSRTDTTVARHVRRRRLERIRDDLASPLLAGQPVEQIIRRWGVDNISYFGQVFKKVEGTTPAEYRRRILQP